MIKKLLLLAGLSVAPALALASPQNQSFGAITTNSLSVGGNTVSLGGNLTTNGALNFSGSGSFVLPLPGTLLNASALPSASTSQIYGGTGAAGAAAALSSLPNAVQGNITAVGTLSSGVWQASPVGVAYGGTGANTAAGALSALGAAPVANAALTGTFSLNGSALSLGGAFTTSGAYPLTFTISGATNITFPSGTNTMATAGANSNITSLTGLTGNVNTSSGYVNALGFTAGSSRNIASQLALSGNNYLYGTAPSGGTQDWCFCGNDQISTTSGGFSKVQITETASSSVTGNGGRSALGITFTEGTSTTGAYPNFEGIQDSVFANAGLSGGTYANPLGSDWGADVYDALSGTGYSNLLYGSEFDIAVNSGAHVGVKNGISIVQESNDTARGYVEDAAVTIENQLGDSTSWQNIFQIGGIKNGIWPSASDSCLMCAVVKQYGTTSMSFTGQPADTGVDFRVVNFTTQAFASNGFQVDPSGNEYAGNLSLTGAIQDETSSVASVTISSGGAFTTLPLIIIQAPAPGGVTATASVATMAGSLQDPWLGFGNSGTGYVTGDIVAASGDAGTEPTYIVTATGGVVTKLTLASAGSVTAIGSQPHAMTGGSGSGLTATLGYSIVSVNLSGGSGYQYAPTPMIIVNPNLGITYQAAVLKAVMSAPSYGNLSLNPSGGNVQIGPGTAIATNSTSGFLAFPFTAAAPTGACTSTGGAKIEYNPATHSINVCDPTAAAWYHETLTSGAN